MKKFILPILFIAVALLFFATPLLIKVKINCKSQYGDCPPEIISGIEPYRLKSLRSAQRGIAKFLKGEPSIINFSLQYKLPNILQVNVLMKKPLFAVEDKNTGKFGLVDQDGKTLSIEESSVLPFVSTYIDLKVGESVNPDTFFALKIVRGVYEMYQVARGEIKDGSLVVELPPQLTVTFPLEGDYQILLGELRLVYAKIQNTSDTKNYSQIDLRFRNPVLR